MLHPSEWVIRPLPLLITGLVGIAAIGLEQLVKWDNLTVATAHEVVCQGNKLALDDSDHLTLNIQCDDGEVTSRDGKTILAYVASPTTPIICRSHTFGIDQCSVKE